MVSPWLHRILSIVSIFIIHSAYYQCLSMLEAANFCWPTSAGHGGPNLWNEGPDPRWGDDRRCSCWCLGMMSDTGAVSNHPFLLGSPSIFGSHYPHLMETPHESVAFHSCHSWRHYQHCLLPERHPEAWGSRTNGQLQRTALNSSGVHSCAFLLAIFAASCSGSSRSLTLCDQMWCLTTKHPTLPTLRT